MTGLKHILLIEDNPGDAKLIAIYLSEAPDRFELNHVETLQAGLNHLQVSAVDFVLLDLSLPDTEGTEGLRKLHSQFPDLPIIVLTGLNDETIAMQAIRMGAQDYLVKGMIDGHYLVRGIRYTLERKAAELESKRLHAELARRERLAVVGQTVASLMHYVKNVLTRMVSSERLIDQMIEQNPNEKLRDAWPIMRRATDDLNHYVKGMLDLLRDRTINLSIHNLNEVATKIYDTSKDDAERLGIALELDLDPTVPNSTFDEHLINDAALNLLINALEAVIGEIDSKVHVATRYFCEQKSIQFCISHNGPCIPNYLREHVFNPFFMPKGVKGTGLGPALAQKNVVAHFGQVTFESIPGQTQFCMTLPVNSPVLEATI